MHVGDGRNAPYIDLDSKIDSESDPQSRKLFVYVVNFKVICFDIAFHAFMCSETWMTAKVHLLYCKTR